MNQFARDDFDRLIFDDVDITELYNWRIMTTDEDKEFRFGLDRNISYEEGVFGEQLYTGITHKPLSFDVTFVKAKVIEGGVYVPQTINDKDLSQLGSLIFKGEPKALRFKNRLYYGMFKSGTGWKTTGNKGYVTDQLVEHYKARAKGGVGLFVTEVVTIEPISIDWEKDESNEIVK